MFVGYFHGCGLLCRSWCSASARSPRIGRLSYRDLRPESATSTRRAFCNAARRIQPPNEAPTSRAARSGSCRILVGAEHDAERRRRFLRTHGSSPGCKRKRRSSPPDAFGVSELRHRWPGHPLGRPPHGLAELRPSPSLRPPDPASAMYAFSGIIRTEYEANALVPSGSVRPASALIPISTNRWETQDHAPVTSLISYPPTAPCHTTAPGQR